ncbi:unnamed protein product [Rhodiola kirilowii]
MSSEQNGGGGVMKATIRISQVVPTNRRRTASTFTTSVAHAEDDDEDDDHSSPCHSPRPGEVFMGEKELLNGDIYIGQWVDDLPHGHGKYLWVDDNCMYVGEWFRGKAMGKGRFSWPSGATYEGEFKGGYMDGQGTYIGPSDDTYKGSWVMNLKHGNGMRCYPNGDYYEGDWRRGLQDGRGRYEWRSGTSYNGKWKNGSLNGIGTLIWANGNRYDGSWEEGMPKGNGTFRWADGSFYVGVWGSDSKERSGTYNPPSGSPTSHIGWDPIEVFKVNFTGCTVCQDEKVSIWPSQKMQNWPGFEGRLLQKTVASRLKNSNAGARRMSVDGSLRPYSYSSNSSESQSASDSFDGNSYRDDSSGNSHLDNSNSRGASARQYGRQQKARPGVPISKGHKNYELMINLQLGLRHSVGRPPAPTSFDHKLLAFDLKEKVWTKFPTEGSKHTPRHPSCEFKWKDYCPLVFRTLRKLFKVDPADYMLSICGDGALRELSSPGKSGSFFYLTSDDKYMIKTMKKAEVKVLLRMLPAYFSHVRSFENTLLTKFFGLHCVKLAGNAQKKVRFVIMGNLFCTNYAIQRRFDLKGSSQGRTTDKPLSEVQPTTTLKDLDLNYIFRLPKVWYQEFCRQVDHDVIFLEKERIMDYSLLVGLHFKEPSSTVDTETEPRIPRVQIPTGNGHWDSGISPRIPRPDHGRSRFDPGRKASFRLGIKMPARVERTERRNEGGEVQLIGEPTGEVQDVILFFGIIDILQDYDINKKIEHAYKAKLYDATSISAVEPKHYAKRFRDFIFRVFTADTH